MSSNAQPSLSALRDFLRRWLGVEDDHTRTEAVLYQHARSLGRIRNDIKELRRQSHPAYTAEQRRAAVERVIGEE